MTRDELQALVRDVCMTTDDGVHVVDSGRVKMTYEQIEELLRRESARVLAEVRTAIDDNTYPGDGDGADWTDTFDLLCALGLEENDNPLDGPEEEP